MDLVFLSRLSWQSNVSTARWTKLHRTAPGQPVPWRAHWGARWDGSTMAPAPLLRSSSARRLCPVPGPLNRWIALNESRAPHFDSRNWKKQAWKPWFIQFDDLFFFIMVMFHSKHHKLFDYQRNPKGNVIGYSWNMLKRPPSPETFR